MSERKHGGARPVVREDDGRLSRDPVAKWSVSLPRSLREAIEEEAERTGEAKSAILTRWAQGWRTHVQASPSASLAASPST